MNWPPTSVGSAEDASRAHQLASLIDHVTDYAIFLLDADGRVASWNPGAERIKGYRADEIIGRPFAVFYTAEDIERDHPAHELEVAQRDGSYEEEGWRVRKDGTRFWASVVITAIRDPGGRLAGFGKVTRDLTARREAEQELRRANEELTRFASVAAHDLREPLRSIAGFSGLLRHRHSDGLDRQALEYLQHMERAAENMQQLIDDLLAYAKAGEAARPTERVALRAATDRILTELRAAIADRSAEVEVALPAEDVAVRAPSGDVDALLRNLVSNALKFSSAAPRVRIACEPSDDELRVVVEDHGIGLPDGEQERVFQPFHRLHGASEYPGTGLGLAICQRVVARNGGRIGVEPREPAGSRFWFTLPRA